MYDVIISSWYLLIFITLIPFIYKSLNALDFSKLFKKNSTREIKTLLLVISVVFSYLISSAFVSILEKISKIAS